MARKHNSKQARAAQQMQKEKPGAFPKDRTNKRKRNCASHHTKVSTGTDIRRAEEAKSEMQNSMLAQLIEVEIALCRTTSPAHMHTAAAHNGKSNYQVLGKATTRGLLPVGRIHSNAKVQVAPSYHPKRDIFRNPPDAEVEHLLLPAAAEKEVAQGHDSCLEARLKANIGIQLCPDIASPVPPDLQRYSEPDAAEKELALRQVPAQDERPEALLRCCANSQEAQVALPQPEEVPRSLNGKHRFGSTPTASSCGLTLPDLGSDHGSMTSFSEPLSLVLVNDEDEIVFKGRSKPTSSDDEDVVVFKGRVTQNLKEHQPVIVTSSVQENVDIASWVATIIKEPEDDVPSTLAGWSPPMYPYQETAWVPEDSWADSLEDIEAALTHASSASWVDLLDDSAGQTPARPQTPIGLQTKEYKAHHPEFQRGIMDSSGRITIHGTGKTLHGSETSQGFQDSDSQHSFWSSNISSTRSFTIMPPEDLADTFGNPIDTRHLNIPADGFLKVPPKTDCTLTLALRWFKGSQVEGPKGVDDYEYPNGMSNWAVPDAKHQLGSHILDSGSKYYQWMLRLLISTANVHQQRADVHGSVGDQAIYYSH